MTRSSLSPPYVQPSASTVQTIEYRSPEKKTDFSKNDLCPSTGIEYYDRKDEMRSVDNF